jgi:hypothetical protein
MKRVRKLMTCECGLTGAGRSHRYHGLSVYHRQHRRIKGLLSNDSLSFADIGDRLGITRERVRQIAQQLGRATGRERREQHAMDKRMSAWHQRKGQLAEWASPSQRRRLLRDHRLRWGSMNSGVIFQITAAGAYSIPYDFDGTYGANSYTPCNTPTARFTG